MIEVEYRHLVEYGYQRPYLSFGFTLDIIKFIDNKRDNMKNKNFTVIFGVQ
jgi:hypothetical protein